LKILFKRTSIHVRKTRSNIQQETGKSKKNRHRDNSDNNKKELEKAQRSKRA
jgi:hypothetical protein